MATPETTTEGATELHAPHPDLHNGDLAPVPQSERKWGWFPIFNVWTNDVQSLAGYTLAAGLFIGAGISGWWVFAAIVLAGFIVYVLVNLTGKPSVRYGVPYAVIARAAMGVRGAQFPALIRGVTAIFWYGAQTYFASVAMAEALYALTGGDRGPAFLGMSGIDWISYVVIALLQLALFGGGIDRITAFLNFAGPAVYVVMVAFLVYLWVQAGPELIPSIGEVFSGSGLHGMDAVNAFVGVVGTMIAYFAAVIINFGDFARFSRSERSMTFGNFMGLPVSLGFFTFLALFITAGSYLVLQGGEGEPLRDPSAMVALTGNTALTVVAAITLVVATIGINLVANFIPPAYDLANLAPRSITFRRGGLITAALGFVVGAFWVVVIGAGGFATFVDTLGAVLAPLYGVLVADYYLLRRQRLNVADLFSMDPSGSYYYNGGWNLRAVVAVSVAAAFSISAVWVEALAPLSGFAWVVGAALGAALYWLAMLGSGAKPATVDA